MNINKVFSAKRISSIRISISAKQTTSLWRSLTMFNTLINSISIGGYCYIPNNSRSITREPFRSFSISKTHMPVETRKKRGGGAWLELRENLNLSHPLNSVARSWLWSWKKQCQLFLSWSIYHVYEISQAPNNKQCTFQVFSQTHIRQAWS